MQNLTENLSRPAGKAAAGRSRTPPRRVSRRFLAVWLPWWPVERLAGRRPEVRDQPFVTVSDVRGRQVVAAGNRLAVQAGLAPGTSLADARAIVPQVVVALADPNADERALESLARWAFRFTPRVAPAAPDAFFLDVGGCAHLFGGERALASEVRAKLKGFGLTSRGGLASAPGAAWALARYGGETLGVVPDGAGLAERKKALGRLPVAALRLDEDVAAALASFGLDKIHALLDVESVKLTERFGPQPSRRLAQALGLLADPLAPLRPLPLRQARRAFAEPVSRPEDVRAAVDALLEDLCKPLRRAGEGARRVRLVCHRVDGRPQTLEVGTSRPVRRREPLARLFAEKLKQVAAGFGIEEMTLTAEAAEVVVEEQLGWTAPNEPFGAEHAGHPLQRRPHRVARNDPGAGPPARTGDGRSEHSSAYRAVGPPVRTGPRSEPILENSRALAALVDRLGNRFGFDRIVRPAPRRSWMPERAVQLQAFGSRTPQARKPQAQGGSRSTILRPPDLRRPSGLWAASAWPGASPRPVRLASPPQAVQVAEFRGDGVPVSFRFGGDLHWLRAAEGPERLEAEWWREDAPARDYYVFEAEDGRRYWLYRELRGPAQSADSSSASIRPASPPRWFLHGFFG